MRKPLLALALLGLLALASAPRAGAWTHRTHGRQATNAFDALPDLYKENLDDTMLYSASLAPDSWRMDGGPVHQFGTFSASSSAPGHGPGNAFDGNPNTYWKATGGTGEWINIDLGARYRIIRVRFIGVENQPDVQIRYTNVTPPTWAPGTYRYERVRNVWHDEEERFKYYNYRHWRLHFSGVPPGTRAKVSEIEIYATADNRPDFTWSRGRAVFWLRRARDNYAADNWDNALYAMGIAAHYIGDAMTVVHNDNVFVPSMAKQYPSGWTLHKHFEEQVRYHEPGFSVAAGGVVIRPRNWRPTLDNYIDNFLLPYLNSFAENTSSPTAHLQPGWPYPGYENYWVYWLATRDGDMVKRHVDAATQLIYDAWISMFVDPAGGNLPPPGALGFAAAAGPEAQTPVAEAEPGLEFPLVLWSGILSCLFVVVFGLNQGRRPKRKLRRDERGVTPVLGAILVIGLLVIAATTIVITWIPQFEAKNEAEHVDSVRAAWQELQTAILNRENRVIRVKMSADPANVFGLFGQRMNPGHIIVTQAKFVKRIGPVADMYVDQAGNIVRDTGELYVRSRVGNNNRRAFLRFNLSALPVDANIREARLLVFAEISRFPNTWENVTGYSPIPQLLEVWSVDNDTWLENIGTWPGPVLREVQVSGDWPFDNTWEISYDEMWYNFNLTNYVRQQRNAKDNLVSIGIKAARENSSLLRYARFPSSENVFRRPHLLITYESGGLVGEPVFDENWGDIADGGSVVFEVHNKVFCDYTFAFESGGLIKERFGTGTRMISNPDLIIAERVEVGDNIRIYVNRYRIMNSARFSSLDDAVLRVTIRENTDLRYPRSGYANLDNLIVAVRSDYPRAWRGDHPLVVGGYFTDLAGRFDMAGSLDYLLEYWHSDANEIVTREFHLAAVTVWGKHRGPVISGSENVCPIDKDIQFVRRVFDVRVNVTMA